MKITLSKSQWTKIGQQTGWSKPTLKLNFQDEQFTPYGDNERIIMDKLLGKSAFGIHDLDHIQKIVWKAGYQLLINEKTPKQFMQAVLTNKEEQWKHPQKSGNALVKKCKQCGKTMQKVSDPATKRSTWSCTCGNWE